MPPKDYYKKQEEIRNQNIINIFSELNKFKLKNLENLYNLKINDN